MADVAVLPTGGMETRGGGPNWLLIGGVGVAAIFLLMMMRGKQSAGQPTTAAGTSINAALGSIQEQNLNIMGEIGQNEQSLATQMDTSTNTIVAGQTALQGAVATYGNQIYNNVSAQGTQAYNATQGTNLQTQSLLEAILSAIQGH